MAYENIKLICDILIVKVTMVTGLKMAFGFMAMTTISAFHFGLEWIGKILEEPLRTKKHPVDKKEIVRVLETVGLREVASSCLDAVLLRYRNEHAMAWAATAPLVVSTAGLGDSFARTGALSAPQSRRARARRKLRIM